MCQYLDNLDKGGPKTRYKQLEHAANAFFKKRHIESGKLLTVKAHWAAQFLQKHPQYIIQKQNLLAIKRKNAHKPETF